MQFVLSGFTPDCGFRVFAFQGIDKDRVRTDFTVRTDLALIARYGIRVQDLPLLCLGLLEHRDEALDARSLTFTEAEMSVYASTRSAEREAAQAKKAHFKPPQQAAGAGWRMPQKQQ